MPDAEQPVLTVYTTSGSPPCWRVTLALKHKGIHFEEKHVDLMKMENRSSEFLRLNPRGQVPVLVHDGLVLRESLAIIAYIEELYPKWPLYPADCNQRARVHELVNENSNLEAKTRQLVYYSRFWDPTAKVNPAELQARRSNLQAELFFWDRRIKALMSNEKQVDAEFLVGDRLTLADMVVLPQIAYLTFIGLDLADYAAMQRYYNGLLQLDIIQETFPALWRHSAGPKLL